jgi:hypothetical protein
MGQQPVRTDGDAMSETIHPDASRHLPPFITALGETDVLMVIMSLFLTFFVLMVGILYFRLHALPDRFAHKKVQLEIVCVLGLIAMFTHMHIFWIAGLLLAMIDLPDFSTPLNRIAGSTESIAISRAAKERAQAQRRPVPEVSRNYGPATAVRTSEIATARFNDPGSMEK